MSERSLDQAVLTLVICVGSSCHLRGSDDVAAALERLIEKEGMGNRVELIGAFCIDKCSKGVSLRVGDQVYYGIRPEETEGFFYQQVVPHVQ